MYKLVTDAQLAERDRLTRVETMLNAFDGRMTAHEDDCLKDREITRNEISRLNETIERNHTEWRKVDDARHRSNTSMLSWTIKLLVTITLAILGYIAMQAFEHIDWTKVKVSGEKINFEWRL